MLDDPHFWIDKLLLAPPLLMSLTVHEFAHARTAEAFGDDTAKNMGRCTLNPLAHLDLVGTLCLLFSFYGWAKPVPVNPTNLHPPRLGNFCVSLAGPLSNLLLCLVGYGILRAYWAAHPAAAGNIDDTPSFMLYYVIVVNIVLCTFNLIPLFPLDGHSVLGEMLSIENQRPFMYWQVRHGPKILMMLIFAPRFLALIVPNFRLLAMRTPWLDPLSWYLTNVQYFVMVHVLHA